jgi:hypothetical protein
MGTSAIVIGAQRSATGSASTASGSRFCTSRMVHSASRCAGWRVSTTTPAWKTAKVPAAAMPAKWASLPVLLAAFSSSHGPVRPFAYHPAAR